MPLGNRRPGQYHAPRSWLERKIVGYIISFIVSGSRTEICFEDHLDPQEKQRDADFVLAAPSVWTLIKILIFPAFQSGETYRRGDWYLIKGELTAFLEDLYQDQNRVFFRYFLLTYVNKHAKLIQ